MSTKRSLAQRLGVVVGFDDPSPGLEQYRTPPELAAHLVHTADLQGDVADCLVVDLGSGTGMLALAALLREPADVVAVELDDGPLATARENESRVAAPLDVSWIRGDATRAPVCPPADRQTTVLMNPPFGAQSGNEHADRAFLESAATFADVSYSIHNEGSQSFVESFAADNGGTVTRAFRAEFPLPNQFDHHDTDSETLEAELFRIEWGGTEPGEE